MPLIQRCLVTFGIVIGIIGVLHGSAELLQGAALVESRSVEALPQGWPNSEFHTVMKGSPVFSLLTGIPFYVLGLLAITVSTTLIVVSATYLRSERGLSAQGLSLFALLNVGVLLFGAGAGTPFAVGLPVVVFGALALVRTSTKQRDDATRKRLRFVFHLSYWLQILSWALVFPVMFVLSFYTEIPRALFLFSLLVMPVSILGALAAARALDATIGDVGGPDSTGAGASLERPAARVALDEGP